MLKLFESALWKYHPSIYLKKKSVLRNKGGFSLIEYRKTYYSRDRQACDNVIIRADGDFNYDDDIPSV